MNFKKQYIQLLKRTIEVAQLVLAKQEAQTLLHPVEAFKDNISQPYGNPSSRYPVTGVHIGTDYRTPVGAPIRAPFDGEVIKTGTTKVAGHFIWYQYTFKGKVYVERYMHLHTKPSKRKAKRGEIIAVTGNTGMSTGPHLHQDIWPDSVRIGEISRTNWRQLTINPQVHYK